MKHLIVHQRTIKTCATENFIPEKTPFKTEGKI
jgi:hypothetical protein